jgi:acetyl-CoA acetyltransferase
MSDAVIVRTVRTPIGKFGGRLSPIRPYDLAAPTPAAHVRCKTPLWGGVL